MADIALLTSNDIRERLRLMAQGIEPEAPVLLGDLADLLPVLQAAADESGRAVIGFGEGLRLAFQLDQGAAE